VPATVTAGISWTPDCQGRIARAIGRQSDGSIIYGKK
jgi:hypothetical protein